MVYFEKAGRENTDRALAVAKEGALERNIKKVVVASTYGDTGLKACELFKDTDIEVIVVTHNYGFKEPGKVEMKKEVRRRIEELGGKVLSGTMVLRSLGTAIRDRFGGYSEQELIANTLRIFCQGIKVCVEMAAMVSDCGFVGPDEDIIAVAGTGRGADTVAVIRPAPSNMFFDIKVKEILAKPKNF